MENSGRIVQRILTELNGFELILIVSSFLSLGVLGRYLQKDLSDGYTAKSDDLTMDIGTQQSRVRPTNVTAPRSTVADLGESPPTRSWRNVTSCAKERGGKESQTNEIDGNSESTDKCLDDHQTSKEEPLKDPRYTDPADESSDLVEEVIEKDERDPLPDGDGIDTENYQLDWNLETDVAFDDIGGMEKVKKEVEQDIIRPMKEEPEKAEKFDIPLPNVLLHGPPGTGKTYLAKALATELGYPFVHLSGSDVTSKWVNESAEKVGNLFDEAESLAGDVGGAIIFLDELDAMLPKRQMDSHEEDRKVVNEFLTHLQESAQKRVLFIGATNRRNDLDPAATRNGRIDKEISLNEPDYDARVEIFRAQLAGRPHSLSESELEDLAAATEGVVAADIESMVNQAARNAAYGRNGDQIELQDLKRQLN